MRFPLEVVEAVREVWPEDRPLSVRGPAVDGSRDGVTLADTVALARELRTRRVDAVDVSGGGWDHPIGYGYQVPHAAAIREQAGIPTTAVGLLVDL